jgi:hypothetical protein
MMSCLTLSANRLFGEIHGLRLLTYEQNTRHLTLPRGCASFAATAEAREATCTARRRPVDRPSAPSGVAAETRSARAALKGVAGLRDRVGAGGVIEMGSRA